jgi:putative heme-binding domain-containing protein
VQQLEGSPSQEDQIHFAMTLRGVEEGWTDETRRRYFGWFNEAASSRGGMSFGGFLKNIRDAAVNTLSDAEKTRLAEVLKAPEPRDPLANLAPRDFVKAWTVPELTEAIENGEPRYDFEQGKQMFAVAQCYKCHRMGVHGGILGPDLTGAGGRFSSKDLLEAIIDPNKSISDQYGATQFLTVDGKVVVGKVVNMAGNDIRVLTNLLDPSQLATVKRDAIEDVRPSSNSMMPSGLLDTLTEEEIIHLMAYLRAGGNPDHPFYQDAVTSK